MAKVLITTLLFLFPYLYSKAGVAQQEVLQRDSLKQDFVTKMKLFSEQSAQKSQREFDADRAEMKQNEVFEHIKKINQKARSYLKKGSIL